MSLTPANGFGVRAYSLSLSLSLSLFVCVCVLSLFLDETTTTGFSDAFRGRNGTPWNGDLAARNGIESGIYLFSRVQ